MLRSIGWYGAGASTMQSHFVQAFLPVLCGAFSGCCSPVPVVPRGLPPDNPVHRHTPGNSFLQAPGGLFRGADALVTGDDDMTVATGGEPAGHPHARCNDRCPSAGPQPVQPFCKSIGRFYSTDSPKPEFLNQPVLKG